VLAPAPRGGDNRPAMSGIPLHGPGPDGPASAAGDEAACPRCGGTGFVIVVREGLEAARPCDCRRSRQDELRRRLASIPRRYRHCTLEGFFSRNPSHERALALARRVVQEFPGGRYGLLFTGPCGVGKTHLAAAVLRELVETRGARGLFTEFGRLLRRLQDTYDRGSETPSREVIDPVLLADVLVLDDLGATRTTPWVIETLGLILGERYDQDRLTLITTNLPLEAPPGEETLADRIGDRLASRLVEMCWVVPMEGEDFRRRVKSAAYRT